MEMRTRQLVALQEAEAFVDRSRELRGTVDRQAALRHVRHLVQQLKAAFPQGSDNVLTEFDTIEGALLRFYGASGHDHSFDPNDLQWVTEAISLLKPELGEDS